MSTNNDKSKNERDLGFGYIVVWSVYFFIGVFGSLAIVGEKSSSPGNPMIYSYFKASDVVPFIVATIFAVHLVTA